MLNKIPLLIFSKDRACQLHALLDSINTNCTNLFEPHIIYKTSSDSYRAGYELLFRRHKRCKVKEEKDIEGDFREFLTTIDSNIFCIATDDCIFYRKLETSASEIDKLMDEDTFCFSFRLGYNTIVQDYSTGRLQEPLGYVESIPSEDNCKFIKWHWKSYPPHDNYGYCGGQDFCCYRSSDILPLLDFKFNNMRHVESQISSQKRHLITKEWMVSPLLSCAVNLPNSNVQEPFIENFSKNQMSTQDLNDIYLKEYTIDLTKIYTNDIVGCHQDIPYSFQLKE